MLYSQLKFVNYLLIYDFLSNIPFNRVLKATAAKGICLGQLVINVNKWRYFIIWAFGGACKKIFKIILNHYDTQNLFIFPIIQCLHPNNKDPQDSFYTRAWENKLIYRLFKNSFLRMPILIISKKYLGAQHLCSDAHAYFVELLYF